MSTPTATLTSPPKCTTAIPDHHGYVPPTACNANYGFYPSWEWNLVFTIGFFLASLFHIAQMLASRKWFCWVLVMGALWEYACFMLRTLGAFDQQNGTFVVVGTLLFLLAPLCELFFLFLLFSPRLLLVVWCCFPWRGSLMLPLDTGKGLLMVGCRDQRVCVHGCGTADLLSSPFELAKDTRTVPALACQGLCCCRCDVFLHPSCRRRHACRPGWRGDYPDGAADLHGWYRRPVSLRAHICRRYGTVHRAPGTLDGA